MPDLLRRPRTVFLFVVLAATCSIVIFYRLLPASLAQNQSTDFSLYYQPVAMNILEGRGITLQDEIAVRYPPGYPVLLAGAIRAGAWVHLSGPRAVVLLIWLCFGFSAGVLYLISRLLWQAWYSLVPVILWITYPFALWLAKQPNSEVPFTLLFLLSIYFLILAFVDTGKGILYVLLSGLLAGLAMMVRPIAIGLGVVLLIFWLYYSQGIHPLKKAGWAAVFLLLSLLPALLWGLQIYRETGQVVLLSTGSLPSIRDGLTFGVADKEYRFDRNFPADVIGVMQDFHSQRGQMSSNQNVAQVITREFLDKPAATAKFFSIKALRSWYALDSMQYEQYTSLVQLVYLILICGGGVLSWKKRYLEKKFILLILWIALYFWSMTTLVLSIVRYTTPVFPLLFILVPGLLKWLPSFVWAAERNRQRHSRIPEGRACMDEQAETRLPVKEDV